MAFLPTVTRAEYRAEHMIHVVFNDGREGTVDVSEWLVGPVFEPLKDEDYVQRFFIEGGNDHLAERRRYRSGDALQMRDVE